MSIEDDGGGASAFFGVVFTLRRRVRGGSDFAVGACGRRSERDGERRGSESEESERRSEGS